VDLGVFDVAAVVADLEGNIVSHSRAKRPRDAADSVVKVLTEEIEKTLQASGIDLARLVIVKTRSRKETLWAVEQALRSAACGAVLAWPDRIRYPELRRLQLAIEASPALAVLFRPSRALHEASPAALRIGLGTHAGGLAIRILKRRGAALASPILVRIPPVVSGAASSHVMDRPQLSPPAPRSVPAGIGSL